MKTANIETIAEGKRNIYLVPVAKIIVEPKFNVREEMGDLAFALGKEPALELED